MYASLWLSTGKRFCRLGRKSLLFTSLPVNGSGTANRHYRNMSHGDNENDFKLNLRQAEFIDMAKASDLLLIPSGTFSATIAAAFGGGRNSENKFHNLHKRLWKVLSGCKTEIFAQRSFFSTYRRVVNGNFSIELFSVERELKHRIQQLNKARLCFSCFYFRCQERSQCRPKTFPSFVSTAKLKQNLRVEMKTPSVMMSMKPGKGCEMKSMSKSFESRGDVRHENLLLLFQAHKTLFRLWNCVIKISHWCLLETVLRRL